MTRRGTTPRRWGRWRGATRHAQCRWHSSVVRAAQQGAHSVVGTHASVRSSSAVPPKEMDVGLLSRSRLGWATVDPLQAWMTNGEVGFVLGLLRTRTFV